MRYTIKGVRYGNFKHFKVLREEMLRQFLSEFSYDWRFASANILRNEEGGTVYANDNSNAINRLSG